MVSEALRSCDVGCASAHRSDDERCPMQMTAVLTPAPEGGFVALNPETGTTTQGDTVEQAIAALREAVELYLEVFPLKLAGAPPVTTIIVAEHA